MNETAKIFDRLIRNKIIQQDLMHGCYTVTLFGREAIDRKILIEVVRANDKKAFIRIIQAIIHKMQENFNIKLQQIGRDFEKLIENPDVEMEGWGK